MSHRKSNAKRALAKQRRDPLDDIQRTLNSICGILPSETDHHENPDPSDIEDIQLDDFDNFANDDPSDHQMQIDKIDSMSLSESLSSPQIPQKKKKKRSTKQSKPRAISKPKRKVRPPANLPKPNRGKSTIAKPRRATAPPIAAIRRDDVGTASDEQENHNFLQQMKRLADEKMQVR